MKLRKAQKAANDLIKELEIDSAPVDIEKIARHLDVAIQYEELDDDVASLLVVSKGVSTIAVNKTQSIARQRFAIAHCLGHKVLHVKKPDTLFIDKAFKLYAPKNDTHMGEFKRECEANFFAENIIMPEGVVKKEIEGKEVDLEDELQIRKLEKKFVVSAQVLGYRLGHLDYDVSG